MKALAIDSAVSKLAIAARNEDKTVTILLDIGMKQSETFLPAVDEVLAKAGLTASELDCTVLSAGPGSFTGLRLAFAACKAIEQAHDIPVYGVPTLETYAYPYRSLPFTVVPAIDAKKDKFYACIYDGEKEVLAAGDYDPEVLVQSLSARSAVFVCGPDAVLLENKIKPALIKCRLYHPASEAVPTDSLFAIAAQRIADNVPPLKDFDGPLYLRASEAEVKIIS